MLIGEIIQDFRISKEITEEELAKFCNITTKELEEIESGKKNIGQELFQKMVEGLGIGFKSYKGEIQAEKQEEMVKSWTNEWKVFLKENKEETKAFTEEQLDYLKDIEFDFTSDYDSEDDSYNYQLGFHDDLSESDMLKGKANDLKKLFEAFGIEEKLDEFDELEEYDDEDWN